MWRDVLAALTILYASPSAAQEHHHPPEHVELHTKFYSNWMMPDHPSISCCSNQDCAPSEAKQINGVWYGKRATDKSWRRIPPEKIEYNRDSPDGRSHMCASMYDQETVYCFITGSGS